MILALVKRLAPAVLAGLVAASAVLAAGTSPGPSAARRAVGGVPAPVGLRCENLTDPQGLDAPHPSLSWRLPWDGRGRRQTAYQVRVASTPQRLARQGDLWDSGQAASGRSLQVGYSGRALTSGQPCWWQVRAWDERGHASAWSLPARWSMGLLRPTDWHGQWIGVSTGPGAGFGPARWIWFPEGDPAQSAPPGVRDFRRRITLPADRTIRNVTALVTADNEFSLFVNGHPAGAGNDFHAPQSLDLTPLFHPGVNTLAIQARNTGDAPNPAGLLGVFRVAFTSGVPLIVGTDGGWRAADHAPDGWERPGYDDAGWAAAQSLGQNGMEPWGPISGSSRALPARYLRREFTVTGPVRRATVYFSGLGLSELSVNGRKVGAAVLSPALSQYDRRCYYVACDVTPSLRPGHNALGVILGNGRFFAPRLNVPIATRDFGPPRLLLQMDIFYRNGSTAHIVSDGRWKATDAGPVRANNEYDGEDYDARREMPGWDRPGFADAAWSRADTLPAPGGVLSAQTMFPIRVVQTLRPVAITHPAPGVVIFDMGQNMAGWCRLAVSGPAGTQITLRHAERLRADGGLYTDNLRSATQTDHYTLRGGGPEVYQPRFTIHGFRYVEVRGFPGTPTRDTLRGEVVRDAVPSAGDFVCSNPLVNRIYHNIRWGVADNYRSIPTDCPQRDERQGWMGDRSAESRGESYLFDVDDFYAKWSQDMADAQRADGAIPDVCPAYWTLYNDSVTWPSSAVLIPAMLYEQYGDVHALARQYPAMQRWMVHMRGYLSGGLMPRDTYGDWCAPPNSLTQIHSSDPALATDGTLLGTAYYEYCLRLMARCATVLGKPDDARRDLALAGTMTTAFNARFLSAAGIYGNGSATSSILPLALGLTPTERQAPVTDALVRSIDARGGHVNNGLVGGQWLMRALTAGGHADLAYHLLTQTTYPSWGYMVQHGATTIWELWNGDTADPAMNSGNHVMLVGDLITWLYEDLAGIASDSALPGFRHVVMRPHPVGDLRSVSAMHASPYGIIRSAWRRSGRRFTWQITIPANTTATVCVPAARPLDVQEGGRPAQNSLGVTFLHAGPGAVVYRIGSGQYRFTSLLPPADKML